MTEGGTIRNVTMLMEQLFNCTCRFHFRTAVSEEVELLEAIYINELTVVLDDEYVQIICSP